MTGSDCAPVERSRWGALRAAGAVLVISACGGTGEGDDRLFRPDDTGLRAHETLTFEEFREQSRSRIGGVEMYLVEWDIRVDTEEELRVYYEKYIGGRTPKSAVHQIPVPDCMVENPPGFCSDDKYEAFEQLNLRYCISDAFGANKALAVELVAEAASLWSRQANVRFTRVTGSDHICKLSDPVPPGIDFKVWFPSGTGASTAPYPYRLLEGSPDGATFMYDITTEGEGRTPLGTAVHELGHILGLTHEFERADWIAPWHTCSNVVYGYRELTPAPDYSSVMQWDWESACTAEVNNEPSFGDGVGLRSLYGLPVAWLNSAL